MKVGTDGVLLGAWATVTQNPLNILDIGAGTGLISLMLAQRSTAENIEAIEIEENAYEQCVENFEASPWADRLFCYHAGLDEFVAEMEDQYDLIVSNPPFYSETTENEKTARNRARQTAYLPFGELLEAVGELLAPKGAFATILPYAEEKKFIALAASHRLFPKRIMRVRGNPTTKLKRSLIEFTKSESTPTETELTIEIKRHEYTLAYQELTKDFYLKM